MGCNVTALEPDEVLVVVNQYAGVNQQLADYYMQQREIPAGNMVKLWLSEEETISREMYEQKVAQPVRRFLAQNDPERDIRCLAVMYGMPLKVAPRQATPDEQKTIEALQQKRERLHQQRNNTPESDASPRSDLEKQLESLKKTLQKIRKSDQLSALDSELALVRNADYPLDAWVLNPFCLAFKDRQHTIDKADVLMVSRLDGPTSDLVRRMIDDSIAAEQQGLSGKAYFDARWPYSEDNGGSGYAYYDRSIHLAAKRVKISGRMPVVIDDQNNLFAPTSCPDAALYCGWYSLADYVPAFAWSRGAIGYHIASAECETLKRPNRNVWCKRMLEAGAAATIGPVAEPYVSAFPIPEIFFNFLVDGYLCLAECYLVSLPYLSWRMVLIGDPLYRPFGEGGRRGGWEAGKLGGGEGQF